MSRLPELCELEESSGALQPELPGCQTLLTSSQGNSGWRGDALSEHHLSHLDTHQSHAHEIIFNACIFPPAQLLLQFKQHEWCILLPH